MPTLRIALHEYFAVRARPHTGDLFIETYGNVSDENRRRLDQPLDSPIRTSDVGAVLSTVALGRAITAAELHLPGDPPLLPDAPLLSDNAVSWLVQACGDTSSLIAALLAGTLLGTTDDVNAIKAMQQRIQLAFDKTSVGWDIDYAGLVRVGRLLAAHRDSGLVVARTLAEAALLVMHRPAWRAVHAAVGDSHDWGVLRETYAELRALIATADPDALDLVVLTALFPRDALARPAKRIADVRLGASYLGFAWPGTRGAPTSDPIASAPQSLHDSLVITHMLIPGLALAGIKVTFPEPSIPAGSFRRAVGELPGDGSWREVLRRVAERYAFGAHVASQGQSLEALLDIACGAPPIAPAARPAAAAEPSRPSLEGPTHQEILASFRQQGVRGQSAVLEELALMCDARMVEQGAPRVILMGEPGTGKSTILSALASATRRPYVRVDASSIGENGWLGLQVADVAAMIYHIAGGDMASAERAVLGLDELDKLRTIVPLPWATAGDNASFDVDTKAAAVRVGRQESLLALVDRAGVVTFTPKSGAQPLQLRTRHLVIVAAGAFRGLSVTGARPSPSDIEAYGFITELVGRMPSVLRMDAPTVSDLEDLFVHGPDAVVPATAACKTLGYHLTVAPEAVRMVAAATASASDGLSPRTGAALITTIVRRALLDALHGRAPTDGRLLIGPDEILRELRAWRRPSFPQCE